jgi:hypothetical protein
MTLVKSEAIPTGGEKRTMYLAPWQYYQFRIFTNLALITTLYFNMLNHTCISHITNSNF